MKNEPTIYLDYAASTPVDERVVETMIPFFTRQFGNPSSNHVYGQQAEGDLENARQTVADLFHASPDEIIFTACGTESDNLALRGAAFAQRELRRANHLLVSPVEHHAVLDTARSLAEHHGFDLELLPVDEYGAVSPEDVEEAIRPDTAVVSVIYANNEIGTVNPIEQIGAVCRRHNIPFHTDAVQAVAHLPIDVQKENIDLMSLGAHKFYGPKGIGALYVRHGMNLVPQSTGGKQEFGLRAGTQNLPYIAGLAKALTITRQEMAGRSERLTGLRDNLIQQVIQNIPRTRLTGHPKNRLPNHASFVFRGVNGNTLLMLLDAAGFACSSGAACKTGNPKPSEVLTAIGINDAWALGSLRVTLGKDTTLEEVDAFTSALPEIVKKARSLDVEPAGSE